MGDTAAAWDPADMLGAVRDLPDQLARSWQPARRLRLPATHADCRAVVVAGMGGSAIGGDLAVALLADRLRVPAVVVRDDTLPAWVGPTTLVIGTSHSGNTLETLGAFGAAGARGARRVAVTSGGRLAALAAAEGVPLAQLPAGGQPRAGLGAGLANVLAILTAAGLIPNPGADVATAVGLMRDLVADDTPARWLADRLPGQVPMIVTTEDMAPVARRWKTQLNENAKVPAVWDTLPELQHNTVMGYANSAAVGLRQHVVLLGVCGSAAVAARRCELTAELLTEHGLAHSAAEAPAGPRLAQALWLVQLGDLVSVYLAQAYGVDPTPVPLLARLKRDLAASGDRGSGAGQGP